MLLHLAREFFYGRYHGFRWFSWITGVPVIWLVYASGIGGYWLVWDKLGQFSAIASAEWFDWLPIFADPATRNFLTPESLNDRFFSLLVFLHIGIPLLLMLALWAHLLRVSRPDVFPSRALGWGSFAMLLALSLAKPTVSHGRADLAVVPAALDFDWYYLFIHPLMYLTSPAGLGHRRRPHAARPAAAAPPEAGPIAVVNPPNCNGCRRCFEDALHGRGDGTHPDKPGLNWPASSPTCAPAAASAPARPSSTPFRSIEQLVTGIDMPRSQSRRCAGDGTQDRRARRVAENRRLRRRVRRGGAPPGKRRHGRAEPDVQRPAAAVFRRIRPARRRRRRAGDRLPRGQMRLPERKSTRRNSSH